MKKETLGLDGTVYSIGCASFIREVAAPIAKALDKLPDDYPDHFRRLHSQQAMAGTPKAQATSLLGIDSAIVIGATFVSSVILVRIIEKIWDEKLWPSISCTWRNFVGPAREGKLYALGVAVNFEGRDSTILVVAVGETPNEVSMQQTHVPKAMQRAAKEVQSNIEGATLVYVIEGGIIHSPLVFADYASALRGLSDIRPIKPPVFIRPSIRSSK